MHVPLCPTTKVPDCCCVLCCAYCCVCVVATPPYPVGRPSSGGHALCVMCQHQILSSSAGRPYGEGRAHQKCIKANKRTNPIPAASTTAASSSSFFFLPPLYLLSRMHIRLHESLMTKRVRVRSIVVNNH